MDTDDNNKNKYEHNHRRQDQQRSEGIHTCKVWVCLILAFGVDHTKNPKVQDIKVLIRYYFGSEKLKGRPNKIELSEAVTELFIKHREGLVQRQVNGVSVMKNNSCHGAGEQMGERSIFIVYLEYNGVWGIGTGVCIFLPLEWYSGWVI